MEDCTFQDAAMAIAKNLALRRFRGDPDRETKVADAISVAWEFSQDAPDAATPGTVAHYAVQSIVAQNHFGRSQRSVDCPIGRVPEGKRADRARCRRVHVELADFCRPGDDPQEIVAMRMDARTWLDSLSDRERRIAAALAAELETQAVAAMAGVSPGRISQIRRELKCKWDALQQ